MCLCARVVDIVACMDSKIQKREAEVQRPV